MSDGGQGKTTDEDIGISALLPPVRNEKLRRESLAPFSPGSRPPSRLTSRRTNQPVQSLNYGLHPPPILSDRARQS